MGYHGEELDLGLIYLLLLLIRKFLYLKLMLLVGRPYEHPDSHKDDYSYQDSIKDHEEYREQRMRADNDLQ